MKEISSQKAFTLVELAIVMTIIGLLIGGILKGQELMENARITSTIAQIKAIEAATITFRDSYNNLPGDMGTAATKIPNCNALCNPGTGGGGIPGDSIIGINVAPTPAFPPPFAMQQADVVNGGLYGDTRSETVLFWVHLLFADLISGVSDNAIRGAAGGAPAWGNTHPMAKITGGFRVGQGDISNQPGLGPPLNNGPSGLQLVLAGSPTAQIAGGVPSAGTHPLIPRKAAQFDRKMDDGKSRTGTVRAYGTMAGCFNGGGSGDSYVELGTSKDCGLTFDLQ